MSDEVPEIVVQRFDPAARAEEKADERAKMWDDINSGRKTFDEVYETNATFAISMRGATIRIPTNEDATT